MGLNKNSSFRNALYTMMARSFLESHLVLGRADSAVVNQITEGLNFLSTNGFMNLRLPPEEEIVNQQKYIIIEEPDTIEEIVRHYCSDKGATPRLIAKLISRMQEVIGDNDYDKEYINTILNMEYERNRKL